MTDPGVPQQALREQAIDQLRKRRALGAHLLIYVLVNAFIVGIWFMTSDGGFFWPIFPIAGWGIGLIMNVWDVYRGAEPSEEEIRHRMDRLASH